MKLSRERLKQIVKEELKNIKEYVGGYYGHGDDFDERSGNSREQQYQPKQYAPAKQGEPGAFQCGICHGTGKVETSIGLDSDYNPIPGESKTCETCQGQRFLKQISENKKLTRNILKNIVKEELEEMMSVNEPQVESTEDDNVRTVRLSFAGKEIVVSFGIKGGSPLTNDEYWDLSDEQRQQVMQKASKAAGVRGDNDYSDEDIDRMMSGEEIPSWEKKEKKLPENKKRK